MIDQDALAQALQRSESLSQAQLKRKCSALGHSEGAEIAAGLLGDDTPPIGAPLHSDECRETQYVD